jgi:hypothetical protein
VHALVVGAALLFWVGVFMVYFTAASTTPIEFFFGRYEPPPADLGVWKPAGESGAGGLLREQRLLLPEGRANAGWYILQVRHRDPVTRAVVRLEPEQRLKRRRVSIRP